MVQGPVVSSESHRLSGICSFQNIYLDSVFSKALDIKPKEQNEEAAFTTVVLALASLQCLKTHWCTAVSRQMAKKL